MANILNISCDNVHYSFPIDSMDLSILFMYVSLYDIVYEFLNKIVFHTPIILWMLKWFQENTGMIRNNWPKVFEVSLEKQIHNFSAFHVRSFWIFERVMLLCWNQIKVQHLSLLGALFASNFGMFSLFRNICIVYPSSIFQ